MPPGDPFDDLIRSLREGEHVTGAEAIARFHSRLVAIVQNQIASIRPKVDAEDVIGSVFRTLIRRHASGTLTPVESLTGLEKLLVVIATNKCIELRRKFTTESRDITRECPEGGGEWLALVADPEPSHEEGVMFAELIEVVRAACPARDLAVVDAKLRGDSVPTIARDFKLSERTVYRYLKNFAEKMRSLLNEE